MVDYCTYFDSNYLARGLVLYRSLRRNAGDFELWALCLDTQTHEILTRLKLPRLIPIIMDDFEKNDDKLVATKRNRTKVEYYFTCTPSLPLFILRNNPGIARITYLDADISFFSSPSLIFTEFGEKSLIILGHRFPNWLQENEKYGIYNVSFLSFPNVPNGIECLEYWRECCLEWCYDRLENGRFADQKYLDDWPHRFDDVVVLEHKGAGLSPWNIANYKLKVEDESIWVDSEPLVFYHFHNLTRVWMHIFDTRISTYGGRASSVVRSNLYKPYIKELLEVSRWASRVSGKSIHPMASVRRQALNDGSTKRTDDQKRSSSLWRKAGRILNGDLIFVSGGASK